ncbi:TonB family protein [Desulfovibrio sp. ZJ369]|uniref:TonB family protein n=1 Tax=Desulfovibrio sp. ZJ369 TaxID=2709793 RepID=UPI0013EDD659|nr:TonB family protein [Desulfovibrio sp. ZJ369]
MSFPLRAGALILLGALIFTPGPASGAALAAADQNDGYSGKVLDKVLAVWAPPPALKGEFEVRVRISLDGQGKVLACTPTRTSGMEALDSSACGAVRQIAGFGTPPYGMPLDVHLAFWTGMPRGKDSAARPAASAARPGTAKTGVSDESAATVPIKDSQKKSAAKAVAAGTKKPAASQKPSPTGLTDEEMRLTLSAPEPAAQGRPVQPKAQDKYDPRYRKYLSRVVWDLRKAMFIPAETAPGTYYATVRLLLEPTGAIKDATLLESSGDKRLDRFVLQGIRRANRVSPPPAGLGTTLELTFTLVRH